MLSDVRLRVLAFCAMLLLCAWLVRLRLSEAYNVFHVRLSDMLQSWSVTQSETRE